MDRITPLCTDCKNEVEKLQRQVDVWKRAAHEFAEDDGRLRERIAQLTNDPVRYVDTTQIID